MDPKFVGVKVRKFDAKTFNEEKDLMQNIQEYTLICCLTTFTGLKVPRLMDDWGQIFKDSLNETKNVEIYKNFKKGLEGLTIRIGDRNSKERKWPFLNFSPDKMEASVSV